MQVGELHRDALRHHPLLAAGVDEQQVLLAVVVEAEIAAAAHRRIPREWPLRHASDAGTVGAAVS